MQTNLPKQVPFLPGHVFNDPYKQNFHKTQQFVYSDGSQQEKKQNVGEDVDINLIDELTKSISNMSFQKERRAPENDSIPRVQPPWIKYDRKVLRFYAYFQEHVVESRLENYRIRRVKIYYYLSDETMFITEPKIENCGIPQGPFLKRQKVPKVVGELNDCYTWRDFDLSQNINIYDRIFRITDCDDFTREFYDYMGFPLSNPEPAPGDHFEDFTKTKDAKINPPDTKEYKEYIEVRLGGGHPNDGLKQYLDNDRKVLSFKVLWHDDTLEGGYNYFTLNYFLADSTVEVKEIRFQNSGRDPFPLLLRKQKLPKKPILTHYPGMSLTKEDYYSPEDFSIGAHINVFGRDCVVYDCDMFTKAYYRYRLGIELNPIKMEESQRRAIKHEVPPYNGYGSPEDSLGNVYSLQPKPPKKDMTKIFTNDQYVMRFEARMISEQKEDNTRSFIISFFCGDDTIQVYQNADKNSGIWGGKFMERKRHEKKGNEDRYVQDYDFQIGGLVHLGAFTFQLLKADDFTIGYMKERPEKFPEVNIAATLNKLKSLSSQHANYDQFLVWIIKSTEIIT